jgi:uncharacterized protein (TIGR02145 family)
MNPTIALSTKTTDGAGIGNFSSAFSGLVPNTIYYLRAYATNSIGTAYGNELSFVTLASIPTVTTTSVSSITTTSAVCGGNVTSDGGSVVTARGICWSTSTNPTIELGTKTTDGSGIGNFLNDISGIVANTTYYVRAYATNSIGTAYGNEESFIADIPTTTIGSQIWMKQNLGVSKYRNGDVIPQVQNPTEWANLTTGAWCYYSNDTANGTVYGKLYNWFAVNDPRGLAPEGWHVATNAEWTSLTSFLGGATLAGGPLKATTNWTSPNTGATNSSGFTALPGGGRLGTAFGYLGAFGVWWTATEDPTQNALAWYRILYNNSTKSEVYHNYKQFGLSVRCVKD